jgi:methionyl-tRNA formyltransferase
MGSPDFAIPSLKALFDVYEICAVVTQPDRPAGRGRSMQESAVKQWSISNGLTILQPPSLRDEEVYSDLASLHPDLIVVAAFGQILPSYIIELPKYGCINVHASLLPRWRGAAPVQAAILEGDDKSGVTIMKMDAGLDTGPILRQLSTNIKDAETGGELQKRLSEMGGQLLADMLPRYISGDIVPSPQDDTSSTYAPMLRKKDGLIDPRNTADRLARQVRAFEPWPSSYFHWEDLRIVVRSARSHPASEAPIGGVIKLEGLPAISARSGSLILERIQPAGKREMIASDFINGSPNFIGALINNQ